MSDIEPDSEQQNAITIKDFREAKDAQARLERQNEIQNRELAMLRAGIPTESKVAQAFMREYDGPLDNADHLHAEAAEWGLWKPEGSDAKATETPGDQARVDADRETLQHGAPPDPTQQPPARRPGEVGLDAFDKRMAAGDTRERASAEVISRVIDAAVKGDDSVLVRKWTNEELGKVS